MDRSLLLGMLLRARRQRAQGGFTLLPGMLVLLALATGSLALVSLTLGDQLGAAERSGSREARVVAEAGLGEIIATFNQPQNRGLLVAGQPMGGWSSADGAVQESLRSPCVRADGIRPGGDGLPSTEARALGDGAFRDLETGQTGTGSRQFRLVRITYSAGDNGQANRRANAVTTVAGQTGLSDVRGRFDRSQINLDDPDGPEDPSGNGRFIPGYNKGYIAITVEGRVSGAAGAPATASVTREFEVLPKCCGTSFGSGGSNGLPSNSPSYDASQPYKYALGSDSRFCGVEFGIITGINGGEHFSYEANDRFTTRDPVTGNIRNIRNILGILNAGETSFTRANFRVAPNARTTTQFDSNDPGRWTGIRNASPTAPCSTSYTWGVGNQCFGSQLNIDGLLASDIPIVPVRLNLPPTNTTLSYSWTNIGPTTRVSNANYPSISSGSASNYKLIIRTNNTGGNPRVEICDATSLPSQTCGPSNWTAISNGSNAWCEYSASSPVTAAPGFHCLGPKISLGTGAKLVIDTSGGPLTFYYNQANDNRGSSISDPLIGFFRGSSGAPATLQHVRCATVNDSCDQPINDSLFAPVGVPDQLNFFGRQSGNLQHIILGIYPTSTSASDPGKVAGAWFYFPVGFIRINTSGCNVASSAAEQQAFWTNDDNWIFSGRIWTSYYYPCGNVHIRVPPSSTANLTPTLQNTAAASFVNWSGVDWLARDVSGARNY